MAIEQVILDLKDTLYFPTPSGLELRVGAKELLNGLKSHGMPYLFVTNSTTMSVDELVFQLAKEGLHIDGNKVITPISVAISHLKKQEIDYVYLIISNEEIRFKYKKAGFVVPRNYEPGIQGKGAVVVGYDKFLSARTLRAGINFVTNRNADLISLNGKLYRTVTQGKREFGALSTARFIASVAGKPFKDIKVIGKPSEEFFRLMLEDYLPCNDPWSTAVIGDSPRIDLETPKQMGMTTILVRTPYKPKVSAGYRGVVDYEITRPDEALLILKGQING